MEKMMNKRKNLKIIGWYQNLSITKKIYLPNFFIIILVLAVSILTASKLASDRMIDQAAKATEQSIDIIIQSMDAMLNSIEEAAEIVSENETVQSVLQKLQDRDTQVVTEHYFLVRSVLQDIVYLQKSINGVTVYTRDGVRVGSQNISGESFTTPSILSEQLVDEVLATPGGNIWIDPDGVSYSGKNRAIVGPTLLRGIQSGVSGEVVGILQIGVSESIFSSLYTHLDFGQTGRFLLLDSDGTLIFPDRAYQISFMDTVYRIFSNLRNGSLITSQIYDTAEGEMLSIGKGLSRMGWVVLGVVPIDDILAISNSISPLFYILAAVGILLELMFAMIVTRSVSRPIIELSALMRKAGEGDFSLRLSKDSDDEIGKLAHSFNHMLNQTSDLMDRIQQQNKRELELELLALQSQIKPHFLYNTLGSIASLIQLDRKDDAFDLTESVSLFFKGVLSKGQPVITIGEDLQTLRYYLDIQHIRYQNKLSYSIDVDAEVLSQPIVKLSLQPIVENSIYHGLKASRHKGLINISGWREADKVHLRVFDNGAGVSDEKMKELADSEGNILINADGFGLSSVDQRIKQYFGPGYGVKLASRHELWTRVDLWVPCGQEDIWTQI